MGDAVNIRMVNKLACHWPSLGRVKPTNCDSELTIDCYGYYSLKRTVATEHGAF